MTSQFNPGPRNSVRRAVVGAVLASFAGAAGALEFETENGTRINWNTTISVGSSWRSEEPSTELFTKADGSLIGIGNTPMAPGTRPGPGEGLAGNQADSGTLNYDKGDRFSTPLKLVTDVEVRKGDFGALIRGKAWYDDALENGDVRLGNQVNNYNGVRPGLGPQPGLATFVPPLDGNWPKASLGDEGFEREQKFSNAMLLDAYVYGSFGIGDTDLQLRLGRQVVNWGESVFIQGVNQTNPIDVPAARRPGAELKEVLLPVAMAYANWGFSFGSMELFYQFEWDNTSIDSCGTYWAVTENNISTNPGRCNSATVITNVLGSQPRDPLTGQLLPVLIPQLGSNVFAQANGLFVPLVEGVEARDSGQFGVAFRFPIRDSEIGLYGMNIHSRTPIISGVSGTLPTTPVVLPPGVLSPLQTEPYLVAAIDPSTGLPFWRIPGTGANPLDPTDDTTLRNPAPIHSGIGALLGQNIVPGRAYWEYPEDIQIYGISLATNLLGWSVSLEVSRQIDVPVQVNGNDLLQSLVVFLGPNQAEGVAAALQGDGGYAQGYDRFNKTQFQVNTVKTFSNVLGAENLQLVAEVGYQENNVPDYLDGAVRYGRGFMFGVGSNPDLAGQLPPSGGDTCSPTLVGVPIPVPSPVFNPQPNGCRNDGYVTDDAWGYRIRLTADYNNVFNSGVTVSPSIFWSHDVDGVSMDSTFIEDRQVLGLGLRFNLNKRYNLDLNYVDYADADFDPLFDRDYYSVSAGVTF